MQEPAPDSVRWNLGPYLDGVERRLSGWSDSNVAPRLWNHDPSLWPDAAPESVTTRLGWLSLPDRMPDLLPDLESFARSIRAEGFQHVLVLGMGGSSLAPDVFARTFGPSPGAPELRVLDSTHPDAVRAVEHAIDVRRTLFVVSSKSGTTLEPDSFYRYFWKSLEGTTASPGKNFVAVTDPGTPLEHLAQQRGFRRCFLAPSDLGGRYSALTVFGLVPAAAAGIDVRRLLARAGRMSNACGATVPPQENPGLRLGAVLGELAAAGRDKVVVLTSPQITAFPAWVEQLIAESLGKDGKGIVPVVDEPEGLQTLGSRDRLLVYLALRGERAPDLEGPLEQLGHEGEPWISIELEDTFDLGQEFFRWEVGVAASGMILGVDPFDQPDVELAKELARKGMSGAEPAGAPDPAGYASVGEVAQLRRILDAWVGLGHPGDYVAIQAYLAPNPKTTDLLQALRETLRQRSRLSTTLGYGPRFLHSTGQLHKGGPPTGLFLQLTDRPAVPLPVPDTGYSFKRIIQAQAEGDAAALRQRGRRLVTVDLGSDVAAGLQTLTGVAHG